MNGPARETTSSSVGRRVRSMRDNPPIGNITISVVRTPKREATKAWAASCNRTLANNPNRNSA